MSKPGKLANQGSKWKWRNCGDKALRSATRLSKMNRSHRDIHFARIERTYYTICGHEGEKGNLGRRKSQETPGNTCCNSQRRIAMCHSPVFFSFIVAGIMVASPLTIYECFDVDLVIFSLSQTWWLILQDFIFYHDRKSYHDSVGWETLLAEYSGDYWGLPA